MNYIQRNIETRLSQAADPFPAVVLAGPRQTGKTTLLRHLFSEYRYVSLDRPLTAEQAEHDAESFLAQWGEPLLIDEVQYAPSLLRFLKIAIDEKRDRKGRFILSGSQKFSLMSVPTVSEWLNVLVAFGHIVLFEPWFGNLYKRLVKAPKLYLVIRLFCAL